MAPHEQHVARMEYGMLGSRIPYMHQSHAARPKFPTRTTHFLDGIRYSSRLPQGSAPKPEPELPISEVGGGAGGLATVSTAWDGDGVAAAMAMAIATAVAATATVAEAREEAAKAW